MIHGMDYGKVRDRIDLPASSDADRREFTMLAGLIISELGRIP